MGSYLRETTVGNIALSIFADVLCPRQNEFEGHVLREPEAEYISSHLFNFAQAEAVADTLNTYLKNPMSVGLLLKFLNDEADCFEAAALEAKEKKQRYVMIVVNALASTLWAHKGLQEQFIENCRLRLGIDRITWDTQTSRIRNASSGKGPVSAKALNLRNELYDQLAVPEEHRL